MPELNVEQDMLNYTATGQRITTNNIEFIAYKDEKEGTIWFFNRNNQTIYFIGGIKEKQGAYRVKINKDFHINKGKEGIKINGVLNSLKKIPLLVFYLKRNKWREHND